MSDIATENATRPQPAPVDLTGIDPHHPEQETSEHLLGTTVAETAAGVKGVHHLGGTVGRTLDRARRQVLGTSSAPGVNVATEDGITVIDVDIVAEYPNRIDDVIDETRVQVTHAVRQLAAGAVRVNITVTDVHGPFDQDPRILDAIDQAGEKARDLKAQADEKAGDLKDQADEKVSEVKDKAAELKEQVQDTAEDVRDQARDARAAAADRVDDFAAQADAKVADFQKKAQAKVDEAVETTAGVTADAGADLETLDAEADRKLDELDAKADRKLDELDEAAEEKIDITERHGDEIGR